mmetsp:Transcript_5823/g.8514  ORF Transcript_5823/g.8514 Transcript_5823/m.8514 type:complete len:83 (-) Transcript_5823:1054-1302(-)
MTGCFDKHPGNTKYAVENLKNPTIPGPRQYDDIQAEIDKQYGGTAPDKANEVRYVCATYGNAVGSAISEEQSTYNRQQSRIF